MNPIRHANPARHPGTSVGNGNGSAFFYGTLMAPDVLYSVLHMDSAPGRDTEMKTPIRPAILKGYRRYRVRGAEFPAVLPAPESQVRGSYVTGLTQQHFRLLDAFEGDMYELHNVTIKLLNNVGVLDRVADSDLASVEGGEEVATRTYVWVLPPAMLEDSEWDFDDFKRTKLHNWTRNRSPRQEDLQDEGFAAADAVRAGSRGISPAAERRPTSRSRERGSDGQSQSRGSPGSGARPGSPSARRSVTPAERGSRPKSSGTGEDRSPARSSSKDPTPGKHPASRNTRG